MTPIAHALSDRFEETCRTELRRLAKKTASLDRSERQEVEAVAERVLASIVSRAAEVLDHDGTPELEAAVSHLFGIQTGRDAAEDEAREGGERSVGFPPQAWLARS
jgi:hypothetical protein